MARFTIGEIQASGLEIYLLDPAHSEFGDVFPGSLSGRVLTVTDLALAAEMVNDASNATDEEDSQVSQALSALFSRISRVARTGG